MVLWDVAARKRLVDEPLAVKEGERYERGLQPRRQDHRGRITASSGRRGRRGAVGRGRTQAPGRRALAVKEGDVGAWPSAPTARPSRPDTTVGGERSGGVVLWDVATRKRLVDEPLAVKEGDVDERGLQPRRQDHRGRIQHRGGDGGVVLWDVAARNAWSTSHSP